MKFAISMSVLFALVLILTFPYAAMSAEKNSIIINFAGKNYVAELEDNATARDILNRMPLSLNLQRYAGHEYFADLPFRPEIAAEKTSRLEAGHLYYWDGGNSFVINYEEFNSAPYKEVHIGKINNAEEICEYLRNANDNISVKIIKK